MNAVLDRKVESHRAWLPRSPRSSAPGAAGSSGCAGGTASRLSARWLRWRTVDASSPNSWSTGSASDWRGAEPARAGGSSIECNHPSTPAHGAAGATCPGGSIIWCGRSTTVGGGTDHAALPGRGDRDVGRAIRRRCAPHRGGALLGRRRVRGAGRRRPEASARAGIGGRLSAAVDASQRYTASRRCQICPRRRWRRAQAGQAVQRVRVERRHTCEMQPRGVRRPVADRGLDRDLRASAFGPLRLR